jgi:hypothetical protein
LRGREKPPTCKAFASDSVVFFSEKGKKRIKKEEGNDRQLWGQQKEEKEKI